MQQPLSGIQKTYGQTFKLDEGALRKITQILRDHVAKLPGNSYHIRFTAYRGDESFFEIDDLDKILSDDNAKSRRINRLTIRVMEQKESNPDTKEDKSLAFIDFDVDDSKPVRVHVRGQDRDWCFLLAQDIHAQIERVTAGKIKALLSASWANLAIGLALSIAITVGAAWLFFKTTVPPNTLLDSSDPSFSLPHAYQGLVFNIRIVYFVLGGFLLFILFGFFDCSRLLKRMIGASVFYWGDEIEAYERRKTWGRNIFWIIIVGLILSYAGGKLANIL